MSAEVGIGHQINIDIKHWIHIEFWSPNAATKILPNVNILWCCVPAGIMAAKVLQLTFFFGSCACFMSYTTEFGPISCLFCHILF